MVAACCVTFSCDALPYHRVAYIRCLCCLCDALICIACLYTNNRDFPVTDIWIVIKPMYDIFFSGTPFEVVYVIVEFVAVFVINFGEI